MAERTLEEQHAVEREYYLGKTDKIAGKKVSTLKEEYAEAQKEHTKDIHKLQEKYRKFRKNPDTALPTPQPISTAVTFGVIDKIKVDAPEVEKTSVEATTAQTEAKEKETDAPKPETKKA